MRSKMLFTPDFALSDTYHSGSSLKYLLAQALKQGRIPFWTDALQGGHPFLAEWQTGGLYGINLIVFKIFSFTDAYTLLLIINFFLLSLGFFLLLKEFKISSFISLLVSLNFAFNGAIGLRLVHFTLIQTFSLCPLLFYTALKAIKTGKKIFFLLFPIILSQMIFAGFVQIVFMVIIGLLLFMLFYLRMEHKNSVYKWHHAYGLLFIMIMIGIVLALPQILPSLELGRLIARNLQLDYAFITGLPFQWRNIVNFVLPYAFGNPKYGTYPPFSSNWGVFWENTPYIGILFVTISIACFLLFMLKKQLKQKKFVIANVLTALLFLLLVLGKNSPLYVIFNFPPFNFFRVPSRFLLVVNFFIFFSCSFSLDFVYKKYGRIVKCIVLFFLVANFIDLLIFTRDYHLFIPARTFLKAPRLAEKIDARSTYMTLGQPQLWNGVFLKKGWAEEKDILKYLFFKNFLHPNSNLFYDRKTFDIYVDGKFVLRRANYLNSLIVNGITVDQRNTMTVSKKAEQLLRFLDIRYLIVPWKTNQNNLKEIDKISYSGTTIFLYEIDGFREKSSIFYIPTKIKKINYVTDFENLLQTDNNFINNAVVENSRIAQKYSSNEVNFQVLDSKTEEDYIEIKGIAEKEALIVLKKNWYPEWRLYIDGYKNPIYKTNLIHMGFIFPKGEHVVKLKYKNSLLKIGLLISSSVFLIYCFIIMDLSYIVPFISHKKRLHS